LTGLHNRGLSFRLVVITRPDFFPGEAACLEGLLDAGLEKLHLRKPGATDDEVEGLLRQLSSRWYSRLVLHGSRVLAGKYGIPQIHCPVKAWRDWGRVGGTELVVSVSLHSWEEFDELEKELAHKKAGEVEGDHGSDIEYVWMSPLFDSISKPGYMANAGLLQRIPARHRRIKVIGLGGINPETILPVIRHGWDGAAVLGWIWEEPVIAVKRFIQLKNIIEASCK
jgi:thiamine-phosphate pyrophosphorylase